MPFKSEAQKRFMYAKHPKIAKRWQDKTGKKELPEKVSAWDGVLKSIKKEREE